MYHGVGKTAVCLKAGKTLTADTAGTVIDLSAYKGQALLVLQGGTFTKDSIGPIALAVTFRCGDSSGGGDATDTIVTFTARDSTNMSAVATKVLDLTACTGRYGRLYFELGDNTTGCPLAAVGFFEARGY